MWVGVRDTPFELLYTSKAVFIGMLYQLLPYAILPLYATFTNIQTELVRAAASLGARPFRAFRSVVIPLAIPSIIATSTLVFIIGIGFYLTPLLLGPASAPFLANRVYNDVYVFFDLPRAAATCVILIVIASVAIAITWRIVGVERMKKAIAP
jgi:putative spermidine/putrescine transport system permease protein